MKSPLVGHTVVYDNMGITALTHPATCTAIQRGVDCPVTQALLYAPRIEGYNGRGKYLTVLTDGVLHLHPPVDTSAAATEIQPLLDAYLAEVGIPAASEAVLLWWVHQFDLSEDDIRDLAP